MNGYENFILMCRACLCYSTATESIELHSIHGFARINEVIDVQTIAERYTSLIPALNIEADDGLPQQICLECLTKVLQQYQFREMCVKSEQQLRMVQHEATLAKAAQSESIVRAEALNQPVRLKQVAELDALTGYVVSMTAKPDMQQDPLKGCDVGGNGVPDAFRGCVAATNVQQVEQLSQSINDAKTLEPTNTLCNEVHQRKKSNTDTESSDDSSSNDDLDVVSLNPPRDGHKRKLVCHVCSKRFGNLGRHMQMHSTAGRPYKCGHCDYHFANVAKLQRHETKMHNDVQLCNIRKDSDGKDTSFVCSKCQLPLPNADAVVQHLKDHQQHEPHNEKTNYKCDECDKCFCSAVGLNNHQRYHKNMLTVRQGNRLYKCQFCKKTYRQLLSLREHVRTHTGEQPHLCSVCGKSFTSAGNMKQHLLRHSGILRYECPECPRRFPCISDVTSHRKQVHEEPKHCCQQCSSRFTRPSQLKKHMMYHTGERPFQCTHCDKRFVCSDHMRRHLRTHTGEKPYKCEYCERAFAQSNDLIKHLRSHVGEKVYQCQLCPLAFRLACELRRHITVHKDESDISSSGIFVMPAKYQHTDKK